MATNNPPPPPPQQNATPNAAEDDPMTGLSAEEQSMARILGAAVKATLASERDVRSRMKYDPIALGKSLIFKGNAEMSAETFIYRIEELQRQAKWTDEETAAAAKNCFQAEAAEWLHAMLQQRRPFLTWEGLPAAQDYEAKDHLKPSLLARFREVVTVQASFLAVRDLRQKRGESSSTFLDRVFRALDVKNSDIPRPDKLTDNYQRQLEREARTYFVNGLHANLRDKIAMSNNPPPDTEGWHLAAKRVEAEMKPQEKPSMLNELQQGEEVPEEVVKGLEALGWRKPNGAGRGGRGGRGGSSSRGPKPNDRCRYCKEKGHWVRNCPNKRGGSGENGQKKRKEDGRSNNGRYDRKKKNVFEIREEEGVSDSEQSGNE